MRTDKQQQSYRNKTVKATVRKKVPSSLGVEKCRGEGETEFLWISVSQGHPQVEVIQSQRFSSKGQ